MRTTWARKERTVASEGPLTGVALQRLRAMESGTLLDWADNSLSKIGALIRDSQREGVERTARLSLAEQEAAALGQALRELINRADRA